MQYEVRINIIAITTKVLKNSYQGYGVGKNTAMKVPNHKILGAHTYIGKVSFFPVTQRQMLVAWPD